MNTIHKKITQSFYNIRDFLKSKESELVKKYFTLLGYKYTSTILNSNLFHFCTEAVLIILFKAVNCEDNDYLPEEILKTDIPEDEFKSNLECLLGTFDPYEQEIKFSNMKLASMFLKNFMSLRSRFEHEVSSGRVSITVFTNLLRKTVNQTINELSGDDDLFLYEVYSEMEQKADNSKGFTLEAFIDEYHSRFSSYIEKREKQDKENNQQEEESKKTMNFCYQNLCGLYYYFAQCTYESFVNDLQSFNLQSSSLIYVVIGFIKYQCYYTYQKIQTLYKISKENSEYACVKISDKLNLAKTHGKKRLHDLNLWVHSSYNTCNKSFKNKFPTVHSKLCFLNENYLFPLTVKVSDLAVNSYTFCAGYYKVGKEKFHRLKKDITCYISTTYQITYEKASEYVVFTKEKLGGIEVVKITIKKFNESKDDFVKLLEKVNEYIHNINIKIITDKSIEMVHLGKDTLMNSYYRFLGCSDDSSSDKSEEDGKKETRNSNERAIATTSTVDSHDS